MKLSDALPLLKNTVGKPFGELFKELPIDLKTNKGAVGQLLLLHIGLALDSQLTDFDDGELKTNKANQYGDPKETMFITQISRRIDDYIANPALEFKNTSLYQKIQNLVFLPVCKDNKSRENWFFVSCHHVDLRHQPKIFAQLKDDYKFITQKLVADIENADDGFIHTSSGKFLQIRSKDSKPYHPIYSEIYNRYISNKNHSFYFKKEFMRYCRSL